MNSANNTEKSPPPEWLAIVAQQVESLRFGVGQVVIHEHRVVLLERTEKMRFDHPEKLREKGFCPPGDGRLKPKTETRRPTVAPEVA